MACWGAWWGRARRWASASWCRTVTFVGGRRRRRTLLSASGCVKEPHFPEKLLHRQVPQLRYARAERRGVERAAGEVAAQ